MSDLTRGQAAPFRRRVRLGAAGVFVLLVLSGAGALGGDTQPDLVAADSSRQGIDQLQISDPQDPPENRVPIRQASEPPRFFEAPSSACVYDPRYLPHTPDAAEAWHRNCRSVMSRQSECRFNPTHLPRTPDAAEAWYRSCLSRR